MGDLCWSAGPWSHADDFPDTAPPPGCGDSVYGVPVDDIVNPADPLLLQSFWESCRPLEAGASPPDAWAFGATVDMAEELLTLVLSGTKTATASALWDYEASDEPLPFEGQLNIVLDGSGVPRALIRITDVRVAGFDEVDVEHAWLEGEGDRSLATWRHDHERFFSTFPSHNRGFAADMPLVLERFEVVHPQTRTETSPSAERDH